MSALAHRDGHSLPELALIAQAAHDQVEAHGRSMVGEALRSGEALTLAKRDVPHGGWLSWLGKNFTGSQQTASAYMRLYANYGTSRNLPSSIDQALREIGPAFTREATREVVHDQSDSPERPDEVQISIIEQTRRHKGEDVARAVADSMNVAYPEPPLPVDAGQTPDGSDGDESGEAPEVVDAEVVDEADQDEKPRCPTCGHKLAKSAHIRPRRKRS